MKIYKELYIKGNKNALKNFIENVGNYVNGEWSLRNPERAWEDYLFFEYDGTEVEKVNVSIYTKEFEKEGMLRVGNIIPKIKSELSMDEYNEILVKFYEEVVKGLDSKFNGICISEPTSDAFQVKDIITEDARVILENFCNGSNKSYALGHPDDEKEWYKFIIQTVNDNKMFDYHVLLKFLQDEDYWGKKEGIAVIQRCAWDKKNAERLADSYIELSSFLKYYKENNE